MRDSRQPEGYDPAERLTHVGNLLGIFCALLTLDQMLAGNEFLLEQPGYGHMRFLFRWELLLLIGADQVLTLQCGYISSAPVFVKMTGFLHCRRSTLWQQLYRACTCKQKHTQLAGALTTRAAEHPELLCAKVVDLVETHMPQEPGPWLSADEPTSAVDECLPIACACCSPSIAVSSLFILSCPSACHGLGL